MELKFIKTSPTENMTLLIETPVPRERQLSVAQRLIAYGSVYGEQAGYIEAPQSPPAAKRLQMMAGEFCGNATLSLAAWLAKEAGLSVGETRAYLLEVSGAAGLVRCEITKGETDFFGKVAMPLPKSVGRRSFSLDGEQMELATVEFEGITHIIVSAASWSTERAERAAKAWAAELPAAFGILLLDEQEYTLQPLVCVQGVSLIWERGCGSGTSAVGVYLAQKEGRNVALSLKQPGGIMGVEAEVTDGKITALSMTGRVFIVAEGTAYI